MINIISILDVASWISKIVGGIGDFISYIVKFITYIFTMYNMFSSLIPEPFSTIFDVLELIFVIKFALVIWEVLKKW